MKDILNIDLKNASSLLIYGDNGTGKSTITDSIEWFLYDKISHLKGEDIPKNDGIRNKDLSDQDITQVSIEFSDSHLNSKKDLGVKNKRIIPSKHSNISKHFESYLTKTSLENLLIHSDELVKFIISTKSDRLADISNLIGYSEVKKTKEILKKSVNSLKTLIRSKNFDSSISNKEQELLDCVKSNIKTDEQFFSAVTHLCQDLKLDFKIDSWNSFKKLEAKLSETQIDPEQQLKSNLLREISNINETKITFNSLLKNVDKFQTSFKNLFNDKENLKGIKIKSLLKDAKHIIKLKILEKKDECPLCLQGISLDELLSSINKRLEELESLEKKTESLNNVKNEIEVGVKKITTLLEDINKLDFLKKIEFNNFKKELECQLTKFDKIYKVFSRNLEFSKQSFYDDQIDNIKSFSLEEIKTPLEKLEKSIKESDNSQINIDRKVQSVKSAFMEIKKLIKEKKEIESQENTMRKIYQSFLKYQKEEMEKFLSSISKEIDWFFQFMYPSDNIENINLKFMSNDDEDIVGISYNLNFRNTLLNSPKKLLSESYLNCLGLCLFLSSVKSFNKRNKFFILDDVISSFDKNHRLLFGRLLLEKFSDWQMIILTHEDEWFKYLANNIAKEKSNWIIKQVKWNNQIGSVLDEKSINLKEEIEKQIQQSNVEGLGNKIGRYLENLLKDICENLGTDVKFKRGEKNERRFIEEFYNALIKKIKDKKMGLENHDSIKRIKDAQFFRNQTSHDNTYNENLPDLKVCFEDIKKFEALFICEKTSEILLEKNAKDGKISTRSGHLSYNWK